MGTNSSLSLSILVRQHGCMVSRPQLARFGRGLLAPAGVDKSSAACAEPALVHPVAKQALCNFSKSPSWKLPQGQKQHLQKKTGE